MGKDYLVLTKYLDISLLSSHYLGLSFARDGENRRVGHHNLYLLSIYKSYTQTDKKDCSRVVCSQIQRNGIAVCVCIQIHHYKS
jgi:hypothetical protein